VYQPHFDYPEPPALCFHVTDSASIARLPRFAPDRETVPGGKNWFCFTNADSARALIGPPPTPREATLVVDDYIVRRYFTDAYDTARLLRVVSIGDTTRRTLRDPR
jgi:uroporphyrinogen-III synthase